MRIIRTMTILFCLLLFSILCFLSLYECSMHVKSLALPSSCFLSVQFVSDCMYFVVSFRLVLFALSSSSSSPRPPLFLSSLSLSSSFFAYLFSFSLAVRIFSISSCSAFNASNNNARSSAMCTSSLTPKQRREKKRDNFD